MSGSWLVPCGYSRIAVEGVLDFDSVGPLFAESRPQFEGKDRLEIDLQGVRCINSAGLALLLEWLELARSQGVSLRFHNPPEPLMRLGAVANVTALLPVVDSGA